MALCKGYGARGSKKSGSIGTLSQSQSLSTLGGVEFGPDQQKELGKSALESSWSENEQIKTLEYSNNLKFALCFVGRI